MLKEFRDFLLRGNLVTLAVAFVMGVAFAAVVTSFVNDLVMPVIAMIFGKPDFNDLTFTINDAVFRYGAFLTALVTFMAIAAAIFFFVVKPVDMLIARARKPAEEGLPDEERRHQELLAALDRVGAR
jgi:large conductance mechanosensitive channel